MGRFFYTLIYCLLTPFILVRLGWRAIREPAYLANLRQRFGFVPECPQPLIWIHAVSAGEIIAATPLIERLLQTRSDYKILVTNMTPTGRERSIALFGKRIIQAYAPYDIPSVLKRFLKRTSPVMLIIIDTELWPNMLYWNRRKGVRSILVNGRLSEKSAIGYAKVKSLTAGMMKDITHIATQTETHGERFIDLGLDRNKLSVIGSIKFDLKLPADLDKRKIVDLARVGERRLILVAGSTHKGEEKILIRCYNGLKKKYPDLLLILAPRHPQRFAEVEALIKKEGFEYASYSSGETCCGSTDVLLVDALGELIYMYNLADIAFIGGSLVPVGGHNLMEAAAFGLPLIMGDHIYNFEDIVGQFVDSGALRLVKDEHQLMNELEKLVDCSEERAVRGRSSLEVMEKNKGALEKIEQLIHTYL